MRKVEGSFFHKPRKYLRNYKAAQPNVKDSGMFGKIEISVLATYFYHWHQWDITFVYTSASNRWCEGSPDVGVVFWKERGLFKPTFTISVRVERISAIVLYNSSVYALEEKLVRN